MSQGEIIRHFSDEASFNLSYSQKVYDDLARLSGRQSSRLEKIIKKAHFVFDSSRKLLGEQAQLLHTELKNMRIQAVWKQHTEALWSSNYRAEVLAYELSELLGFHLVPLTVERTLSGKKGSLQLFFETPEIQIAEDFIPAKKQSLNKQQLFDFIINHGDRHFDNYLILEDGSIKSIDNAVAFTGKGGLKMTWEKRKEKIKNFLATPEALPIIDKIQSLNLKKLSQETTAYLGVSDSNSLISRLRFLKKYLKKTTNK